jgi:MoaA/NifB/PqqE/SkfB family radical SAM enzyme
MKAGNLTISIPNVGCNKNCPYCISKITGEVEANIDLMKRNIIKVKVAASSADVASVLITSKGEPTLDFPDLSFFVKQFNSWPVELQTNGIKFAQNPILLSELFLAGLNTVAYSVDSFNTLKELSGALEETHRLGMLVRVCLNISDRIPAVYLKFEHMLKVLSKYPIDQLLVRHLSYPDDSDNSPETEWIDKHTNYKRYLEIHDTAINIRSAKLVRTLPHGAQVYDINGLSVSFSDYCVQVVNNTDDIRSLIFLEDGHLYTSWASKASILF